MRGLLGPVLFSVVLAIPASGQTVVIDTLRAQQPWGIQSQYTFPSVRVLENEAVTEAINRGLFMDFLGVDPHVVQGDPLTALWGEENSAGMPRVYGSNWTSTRTSANILTIAMTGEYCGANCEGFSTHYLFDLRTGEAIKYPTSFTAEGLIALNDTLVAAKRRALGARIGELLARKMVREVTLEEIEELNNKIEMFRSCYEDLEDGDLSVADMLPIPNGLSFVTTRCSSHVDREMDDLDPLAIDLSGTWLAGHMTTEARVAFGW